MTNQFNPNRKLENAVTTQAPEPNTGAPKPPSRKLIIVTISRPDKPTEQ